MTPLLLAALLAQPAQAGELHVSAPITMVVYVDGMSYDFESATSWVVLRNLAGGSYQVEIRNVFDNLKAQSLVEVGPDEAVTLTYDKKRLVETGRGPVREGAGPVTPERQLQGAVDAIERAAEDVSARIREETKPVDEVAQEAAEEVEEAVQDVIDEASGRTDGP